MAVIYAPKQAAPASLGPPMGIRRGDPVQSPRLVRQFPARDITYRAPPVQHEPRVDPSYQDLPLSHRARKQIYMASSIFDAGGPRGEAIYTPSRQNAVYGNLRPMLDQVREQPEFRLPSPADFRATVNAGQGVVMAPSKPVETAENTDFVSFGGGPDVPVVRASRDESSLPREFWATSTNLQTLDTRAEYCGARRANDPDKRADSADQRKRRELSSEVLGSARRMGKSTSAPSHDLWSQNQTYFAASDSRLGPRPQTVPEDSAVSDAPRAKVPMSARARLTRNLTVSEENQFPQYKNKSAASESPMGRKRGTKEWDDSENGRRRAERNYSDLFGKGCISPRTGQRRQEFNSTSNCNFLDHQVEIANRNAAHWSKIAPSTPRDASRSTVLPGPSRETLDSKGSKDSGVRNEERACWDTTCIMESGSEIARRMRAKSPAESADAGAPSASERKRLDMSSGQFRRSNGYEAKKWDDGRKGPGPAGNMPTPIELSNPASPRGAPWRTLNGDAAKQRRIVSLMSTVVF